MWSRVKAYVKAHADHFMISIGVSLAITIITNVLIHYLADILKLMHVSMKFVRLLTGGK
jgi:hypothetical protein